METVGAPEGPYPTSTRTKTKGLAIPPKPAPLDMVRVHPERVDYNAVSKTIEPTRLFQNLDRLNPDPILGLMARYRADPFAGKVDLGVGVYRDEDGNTPVLECVRRAERIVHREGTL